MPGVDMTSSVKRLFRARVACAGACGLRRSDERAPVITTGDQADLRGLAPTFRVSVGRLPRSRPAGCLPPLHAAGDAPHRGGLSSDRRSGPPIRSGCTRSGRGGSRVLCPARRGPDAGRQCSGARHHHRVGRLPPGREVRPRVPRRPWACPPRFGMACGSCAKRPGSGRRTVAGTRSDPAPALRARRAPAWPAVVRRPWRRRAPLEDARGVRPRERRSGLGCAPRLRAPSAALRVTATVHWPPGRLERRHDGGETPPLGPAPGVRSRGALPPCLLCSNGAAVRLQTSCGAGVGPTTAARQRRWAGPQVARPSDRIAWRRRQACTRYVAAWSARMSPPGRGCGRGSPRPRLPGHRLASARRSAGVGRVGSPPVDRL